MGFLQSRLLRRFSIIGRVGDIVLVAGLALRLAQRKGLVSDDQVARMGLTGLSEKKKLDITDIALGLTAAYRLLRRR